MKILLGFTLALSVTTAGVASAREGAPPLWSGAFGTEVVAGSVETKLGVIQPGQVLTRQIRRPKRTAVLAKDFAFGEGQYAGVMKAGTVLYGEVFLSIPRVGSTLPPRRKDDLIWCAAGRQPVLCFRWNGPGDQEYSSVFGDMMFYRAPAGNWTLARQLEIVETPAAIDPPYEDLMVLKVVGETGLVISYVRQQGEAKAVENRTYYWDDPVDGLRSSKFKFRLAPVKNAKGEVVAARATVAP
jgi:hypothetical protein